MHRLVKAVLLTEPKIDELDTGLSIQVVGKVEAQGE